MSGFVDRCMALGARIKIHLLSLSDFFGKTSGIGLILPLTAKQHRVHPPIFSFETPSS